jgi:type I restriction enzyme R subunit
MARNLFGAEASFGQIGGDADLEEDADRLDIPIHAFDLIIADECHRGYSAQATSIWRNTLQHFDAVRVGLTATPAAPLSRYSENRFSAMALSRQFSTAGS